MDFRHARAHQFWVDLAVLIAKLPTFEWTATDENIAHLVDREDYWLNAEYTSWITDPEDPQLRQAQAQRKKSGVKPPPKPLLQPVAERPPAAEARRLADLLSQAQDHAPQRTTSDGRRRGTIAQLLSARST